MKLVEQHDATQMVRGREVAVRTLRLDASEWLGIDAIGRPSRKDPGAIFRRQPHSEDFVKMRPAELVASHLELWEERFDEIVRVWLMEILGDPVERVTFIELAGDDWTIEDFVVEGSQEGRISV